MQFEPLEDAIEADRVPNVGEWAGRGRRRGRRSGSLDASPMTASEGGEDDGSSSISLFFEASFGVILRELEGSER